MRLSLKVFGCLSVALLVLANPVRSQGLEKRKIESDRLQKSLTTIPKAPNSNLIALENAAIEGRLDRDSKTLEDESYYNSHFFEGKAGEQVMIELISEEFDAYLLLFDPEGNKIAENDDDGESNNARIVVTLPMAGTYKILANTYEAGEIGSYNLTWRDVTRSDSLEVQAEDLFQQGLEQYRTSNFRMALSLWERTLVIYQQISNSQWEANTLYNLGNAYNSLGEYQQAIELYQQSLVIYREVSDRQGEASSLNNLGTAYNSLREYQRAIEVLEQSLVIVQEIDDRKGEGDSLSNLGIAYYGLEESQKAIAIFQQSLAIHQEIGDREGEAKAFHNLGHVYGSLEESQKAISVLQQSLAIQRDIGDRYGEATSLNTLGIVYRSLKEYQKAIAILQQSLAIKRDIGDRHGIATSLYNLGLIHVSLDEYQKAIEFFQQSSSLFQNLGDRNREALSLQQLGIAHGLQEDSQQSIEFLEQSLALFQNLGDRGEEAYSLTQLGVAYSFLGKYQKSIELYQASLALARDINDRNIEANSLSYLGYVYIALGQPQKALEFFQQSLTVRQDLGDREEEADSLRGLGFAYELLGQYQKSIEFYQQSLSITQSIGDRRGEANSLIGLGNPYDALGEYQKALEFYQQSLALFQNLGDRLMEARSLHNVGEVYRLLGDYEKALEFYQQSLTIKQDIGDREGEVFSFYGLGHALFQNNNLSKAEQALSSSIEILESIYNDINSSQTSSTVLDVNRISLLDFKSGIYRTLQQALIGQNKTNSALEISDRGRARTFNQLLFDHLNPNQTDATFFPLNIQQIQQIAKTQKATLIEYSIIDDEFDINGTQKWKEAELYIWVVSPTGKITFRTVDLVPLWKEDNFSIEELVQFSRDFLGIRGLDLRTLNRATLNVRHANNSNNFSEDQLLKKLHQLLIEPIADLLPQNPEDRVIFMPQSSLFLAPFPALKDQNGTYLIEKHTILTAPSIQTLDLTRQQKRENNRKDNVLIVGNPTMPSIPKDFGAEPSPLASLPGAEREAKAIADLLDTQPLIGDDARKSAIVAQMENADIIHLATHGLLDDIRGMGSAIALAPDRNFTPQIGQTNGLLTAEEIFDMNLKADLVVLSACDTGRGRITGDGVIGLSRSFVSAGIPSILVSLWQVPDAPTAELMSEFYRQWEENPDKAQALRQAMLKTMKTHPAPRNWAAFTLIGEAF